MTGVIVLVVVDVEASLGQNWLSSVARKFGYCSLGAVVIDECLAGGSGGDQGGDGGVVQCAGQAQAGLVQARNRTRTGQSGRPAWNSWFAHGLPWGRTSSHHDGARQRFEDAVDLLERSGAPFESSLAQLDLARALEALRRHSAATQKARAHRSGSSVWVLGQLPRPPIWLPSYSGMSYLA